MKKNIFILIVLFTSNLINSQFNFQRSWGTYFGDERFIFTDSAIDNNGNLYLIGTIEGTDINSLPIFSNNNSYHQNYGGGTSDGFLIKFNPDGVLIWGTYIGGENEEKLMAIDIDKDNNIYIIGDTNSITNIATPNSYQTTNAGNTDFFISKFNENGNIIWSTYYGGLENDYNPLSIIQFNTFPKRTHITLDGNGFFYIAGSTLSLSLSTPNVFQENKGTSNYIIAKFNEDGNRIWTTYFGVNTAIASIKANINSVFVAGITTDCPPNNIYNTYYGTANGFKSLPSNCREVFLNKFNGISGQREWGTYYGGNGLEQTFSSSICLKNNKIFLSGGSQNYTNQEVATSSSYQANCIGYSNFIAQFNDDGTRNWGTYNGNVQSNQANIGGGPSNVYVENSNSYYNYGVTALIDITTTDGYKTNLSNDSSADGFVCKFDSNNNKVWGTYYGGIGNETNVRFHPYDNGNKFYIVGITTSVNEISTINSYQPNKTLFDTNNNTLANVYNIFITHFEPLPLSNTTFNQNSFLIYPNPNNGNFTVSQKINNLESYTIEIFDLLGKKLKTQKLNNLETNIVVNNFSKGVYITKISNTENISFSTKIVIK